jgi:hypothetical protein
VRDLIAVVLAALLAVERLLASTTHVPPTLRG